MTLNDLIRALSQFAPTYGEHEIASWSREEIEDLIFILIGPQGEDWIQLQELDNGKFLIGKIQNKTQ